MGRVEDGMAYILLIGVATSALYCAHRVIGLHKLAHIESSERFTVIRQYKAHIWLYAAGWSLLSFYFFLPFANWEFILALLPGGVIAVGYILPVFRKGRRLRDLGWMKILMIGWSWSWLTAFVPAYFLMHVSLKLSILAMLERMLFIIAITIPFEIRDMAVDRSVGLLNMPGKFGLTRSVRSGQIICFFALLISGLLAFHFVDGGYFIAMALVLALTVWILEKSKFINDDYFFSGLTDGLMILAVVFYSFFDNYL